MLFLWPHPPSRRPLSSVGDTVNGQGLVCTHIRLTGIDMHPRDASGKAEPIFHREQEEINPSRPLEEKADVLRYPGWKQNSRMGKIEMRELEDDVIFSRVLSGCGVGAVSESDVLKGTGCDEIAG